MLQLKQTLKDAKEFQLHIFWETFWWKPIKNAWLQKADKKINWGTIYLCYSHFNEEGYQINKISLKETWKPTVFFTDLLYAGEIIDKKRTNAPPRLTQPMWYLWLSVKHSQTSLTCFFNSLL